MYNKEYHKKYSLDYGKRVRLAVLELLGNKCCKCGFEDKRALQIDHIKGGGHKEKKERGGTHGATFNKEVIKSVLAKEKKYQLLCANCNWIKRFTHNENNSIIYKNKLGRSKP